MNLEETYGDRLKKYCKKKDKEYLLSEITKHLSFSPSSYDNFFKKKVIGSLSKTERRNVIIRAILLYITHGIPLEVFDVKQEEVFTEHSPKFSSLVEFFNIEAQERNKEEFKKQYSKVLKEYVAKAKKEIWIYDYFIPVISKDEIFRKAHKEYYRAIEKQLEKKSSLQYHRLLAFSYEPNKQPIDKGDTIERRIVRQCSDIGFEHIVKCFSDFEDRFTLSYLYFPTRLYSYAILDDNYIITEYLRYSVNSEPRPDMLFISKVEGNADMLRLKNKFINAIERQEIPAKKSIIRKKTFKQSLLKVLDNINEEIEDCEKRIDEIEKGRKNDYDKKMKEEEQIKEMLMGQKKNVQWKVNYLKNVNW